MPDNDPSSALSGLGQAPLKITPGTKPGALPTVSLTSGATIDPTTSTNILNQLQQMIEERQSPYQKFRADIDTAIAHTGYMPTERIKADAEMRQAREAELANLVMNKAQLESGLKQGEVISQYLNTPQGGVGGVGGVGGTAGMSPIAQMIASLPEAEQGYGRLLAATNPQALFKLVHETQLKRPDMQKNLEYAMTLPADQRDAYLGQLLKEGIAPRSYIGADGKEYKFSPGAGMPGGLTKTTPTTGAPGRTTAADWAVDNGFQVISGTRTQAESAALVHHYDEQGIPRTKEGRPVDLQTSKHFTGDAFDVKPGTLTPELIAKANAAGYKQGTGIESNHFSRAPATVATTTGAPSTTGGKSVEDIKLEQENIGKSQSAFVDSTYKPLSESVKAQENDVMYADRVLDALKTGNYGPGTSIGQMANQAFQALGIQLSPAEQDQYLRNLTIEQAKQQFVALGAKAAMGAQYTGKESENFAKTLAGINDPKEFIRTVYELKKAKALVDAAHKDFLENSPGDMIKAEREWKKSGIREQIYKDTVTSFAPKKPEAAKSEAAAPKTAQKPAGAPADAKQAPDGNWYSPDPKRPGKYLKWD